MRCFVVENVGQYIRGGIGFHQRGKMACACVTEIRGALDGATKRMGILEIPWMKSKGRFWKPLCGKGCSP